MKIFTFVWKNFQICPEKFSDLSGKIFRFVWENIQICLGKFSDLSRKIFRFVQENFQICLEKFSDLPERSAVRPLGLSRDLKGLGPVRPVVRPSGVASVRCAVSPC